MKLRLLALGKVKRPAYAELAREYARRIQRLTPFEVVEIADEKKIEKHLKPKSCLILLDEKGVQWSSVDLAWEIGQLFQGPHREIVFLIGGAFGISEALKGRAQVRFSLSKLTLPHQLARVLTLEQIYRALTILKHVPYHHE